ncbi:hypothetical protein BT96DRAFT_921446 [Gymnopus androsaceus JB14]|uniref:Autophagy-related protein 14 n=1 Tax=Gymnopus androsaceus JB14 TaxID=1447944 RepID=A0A6A4HK74_9AGAR|nr:hypothetical protein BT96DRAFT_921446 [Gymnopus androsaceus JB14]
MECRNCQLQQRKFFCDNCIKNHLQDFKKQTSHFALERDAAVAKAATALAIGRSGGMESARTRRARLSELMDGLASLRKDNEQKRERLQNLRNSLAERRQTLAAAKLVSSQASSVSPAILSAHSSLASLSSSIAQARIGLVQELVEVFGIAQDNIHWTIGNLILPVPGDMRRYPPDHINAVLTHTIHFVNLLAFYLGVKLPFHVTWGKGKLGVGIPYIGAVKGIGGENGGWARWHYTHPLHVSASTTSAQSAPSSPFTSITLPGLASPSRSDAGSSSASITEADSTILEKSPTNPSSTATIQSTPSFATGIAMLLYNVAYLAYTQHVNIPLHQVAAGDVLSNLWTVCLASNGLGRLSHETTSSLIPHPSSFPLPHLPPPTPHGFRLEFGQLLQAASRPRAAATQPMPTQRVNSANENTTVRDTASSQDRSSSHTRARTTSDTHSQTRPGRSGKDRRRVSDVSLAKDIVKMRGVGADENDLSQVFEDEEGGKHSEDEWDML